MITRSVKIRFHYCRSLLMTLVLIFQFSSNIRQWPRSLTQRPISLSSEVGLSDPGTQAVINAGFSTLGRLAFGVGQPGTAVTTQESERFANNILGGMATMRDIAALRRLLFEAQTMVMAQLREQVSNPEAAATRKIPPVARESKMRQLKARLPGLLIQGQIEPSHALLTLVTQMWENK